MNVGLTSDIGELGRGRVARGLGWWAEQLAVGLELGMEREVEVTGELRLFIGMMLLKPPLVLPAYVLSSMSERKKKARYMYMKESSGLA
jgi:hypothetical protein